MPLPRRPRLRHRFRAAIIRRCLPLLACGALLAASLTAWGDPLRIASLDQPTPIAGNWRFRPGDDLRWAAATLDDRDWVEISVEQPWGRQGYRGYGGVAWYRRVLELPPNECQRPLGLALGGADWASYEVFVNGAQIGRFGAWSATDAFAVPHPQAFLVPSDLVAPDGRLVIAVRFWQLPASMRRAPQSGGFDGGLFLSGDAAQVCQAVELAIASRKREQVGGLVWSLTFLLVGAFHLLFFVRRREQREYLWFGLFALLFGLNWLGASARWWVANWVDYVWLWKINSFTISLFSVPQALFLWTLFRRPMGRFVRAYLWTLALSAISAIVVPGVTFSLLTSTPRVLVALLFPIILVALIIAEARRGNREARTILGGLLISAACGVNDIVGIRLGLYSATPLGSVGLAALLLSMALSLANRFARVYGELDALNQNLEGKVRERTAIIARQRDEIEQKQKELTASIAYAQRIQQALLPDAARLAQIGRGAFVFFRPRDLVSGDFYWIRETSQGLYLAVADCTGHGVPGAFMALIGIDLLDRLAVDAPPPGLFLERLDLAMRRVLRQEREAAAAGDGAADGRADGMEIALCLIQPEAQRITFAGARRPLYVAWMDGALDEIKGTRRGIGGDRRGSQRPFAEWSADLRAARAFYLVSDGFTDQNGEDSPRGLGSGHLRELLGRIAPLPPSEQERLIAQAFDGYRGNAPQRDDVTLLGVRWQA